MISVLMVRRFPARPLLSLTFASMLLLVGCRDGTLPDSPLSWVDVSAFGEHSCGLASSGQVYCWGKGYRSTPQAPVPDIHATALIQNQCARNARDEVYCWGGEIGYDPVQIVPGVVRSASRGTAVTCAVGGDGVAQCSGENLHGELGNGTSGASRASMAPVSGGYRFASIVATGWSVCGLDVGGTAICWGSNYTATLGRRTTETCAVGSFSDPCSTTPAAVSGNLSFRSIDVGGAHACGIATDGRLYCWGTDVFANLGTAATPDRCTPNNLPCTYAPVQVGARTDFRSIHTSNVFNCGLTTTNEAYCWGSNHYGQLADGVSDARGTGSRRREAGLVSGGHRFSKIALGENHGCGLTDQGEIFCWGSNQEGELGIGRAPNSNHPVNVAIPLQATE
jgi:alpha-tubulin suppressor-like RCC1 family protein